MFFLNEKLVSLNNRYVQKKIKTSSDFDEKYSSSLKKDYMKTKLVHFTIYHASYKYICF